MLVTVNARVKATPLDKPHPQFCKLKIGKNGNDHQQNAFHLSYFYLVPF